MSDYILYLFLAEKIDELSRLKKQYETVRKLAETSLKKTEKRAAYMDYHDSLTDLYNRKKLDLVLNLELEKAARDQTQIALIYINLDRFKSINDTFGPHIGDKVLREVADRLKKATRFSDEVLREAADRLKKGTRFTDLIARVGADEFIVVLTHILIIDDTLMPVVNRIRHLLAEPFIIDGHKLHVITSIGISVYPADGADANSLFKNAHTAMCAAKKYGGDRFEFCTPELTKRAQDKTILEEQLRSALFNNEFYIHYQPKVAIKSGKITGVEALLRWNNPKLGELLPSYFIPLAEEIGLITPMTEMMFTMVCQHINHWKKEKRKPLDVAVNLSGRSFIDLKFMELIAAILKKQNVDPHAITVEITESVLMQEIQSNATILNQFTNLGLKISIDDFGTGYSSLNYLKYFTIDSLKIDQSFVRDIATDPNDVLIVDAIISMAHSLKFKVIAEGVETKEQWNFLKNHGCDEIQGFYFCKPLSPDDLVKFVENHP